LPERRARLWSAFAGLAVLAIPLRGIAAAGRFVRANWLYELLFAGGLACLVLGYFLLFPNLVREAPAANMPAGFYMGEYRAAKGAEPVQYGLYVPPHFEKEKGPFPLIVFLHGYGERNKGVFATGLSQSIVLRFGEQTPNGRFDFAALFPIDLEGVWEFKPRQLEGVVGALNHVIEQHRIDAKRVYLTGHSAGGDLWPLVEAYPEKWAAVAPAAGFRDPDIAKVRHVPIWIFHGAEDNITPVERARKLAEKLKQAKADLKYTEIPNKAHVIWRDVYGGKELYEWFASKKRP
jgi:predicted peptidase